jgi:hypothetical protein
MTFGTVAGAAGQFLKRDRLTHPDPLDAPGHLG